MSRSENLDIMWVPVLIPEKQTIFLFVLIFDVSTRLNEGRVTGLASTTGGVVAAGAMFSGILFLWRLQSRGNVGKVYP